MVTVYIHGDPKDRGKLPKLVEVRAGENNIVDSNPEKVPWKKLHKNVLCGRFIQVYGTINNFPNLYYQQLVYEPTFNLL